MAFVIVEFEGDEGERQRVRLEVADRWPDGTVDTLPVWLDDDGGVHEEESDDAPYGFGAICYTDGHAELYTDEESVGEGRWRWDGEEVQG